MSKRFVITGIESREVVMSAKEFPANEEFSFPTVSAREMACDRLIFNTTEDILLAMEDAEISQKELASKLGKSKSYVSQLLDGSRNMTLKTLADISYALGAEAMVTILKDGRDVSHQLIPERERYVTNVSEISMPISSIKITITTPVSDYVEYATQ